MKNRMFFVLLAWVCLCMLGIASFAHAAPSGQTSSQEQAASDADENGYEELFKGTKPVLGPTTADIGTQGKINVPAGYVFFSAKDTQTLLERMENLVSGTELGMLCPEDFSWFITFEFDESGYVADTGEDADIDAGALLDSFKRGSEEGNKERKAKGWSPMDVVGWSVAPHYNRSTKNLEWGITFRSEGKNFDNYNVRLLGREGVIEVVLVGDEGAYAQALQDSRKLLEGFSFVGGKTYAEYRQGDKMAGYGLAALIGGGAFAAAAKSGFLAKFLKPILVGLAAAGAYIVNLFRRKKKGE